MTRFHSVAALAAMVCLLSAASAMAQPRQHEDSPDPVTGPLAPQTPPPAMKKKHKKPAASSTAAVPEAAAPEVIPADQVHPITSLPRAPGEEAGTPMPAAGGAIPVMGTEAAPAPAAAPAAAPVGEPAATPPPAVTYTQPGQGMAANPAPAGAAQPLDMTPAATTSSSSDTTTTVTTTTPAVSTAPVPPPMPDPAQVTPSAPPTQIAMVHDESPYRLSHDRHVRPFSAVAFQLKLGVAGIGFDIATPIAPRLNLRVGGSYFQYSGSYLIDGITTNGEVKLRSGTAQLDIFPFGNAFRISPGITFYNGNNLNATAFVPGGNNFTLDDTTYMSDPTDPVHGTGSLTFGSRQAPSITIGTGNMIPRHHGHVSVPFEIGIQYIKNPMINYSLSGSVCGSDNMGNSGCEAFSDPSVTGDLVSENAELNSDIHPLRFYPIVSLGVAYSFFFGHRAER